jgi:hypothetical protein
LLPQKAGRNAPATKKIEQVKSVQN